MLEALVDRMMERQNQLAIALASETTDYRGLLDRVGAWRARLAARHLGEGRVVSIEGDFSVEGVAAFLALILEKHTGVPLSPDAAAHHDAFREIGGVEYRVVIGADSRVVPTDRIADHPCYTVLRGRCHPGLVLFSSGSTGRPKAALHDLNPLLKKFLPVRPPFCTLAFLQLDHIGGVNTLLYSLANGGGLVVPANRSPGAVCQVMARYRVELLPTSPTFLNLLLLSGEYRRHDLSALRLITYGTEPMPASTLQRVRCTFPQVELRQTYGMTELGILRAKSRGADSLWVKVGGEGYETKIVDGRLWIRSDSAMLGYLNAPSPFDADGFFDTGDLVETDGEWLHIKGRQSDLINVGGSKVYPAEVESTLLEMENVADVSVHGEPHPLTGQIVVAQVRLREEEPLASFKMRLRRFCDGRLERYKVPVKIVFTDAPLYSERCKRVRPRSSPVSQPSEAAV